MFEKFGGNFFCDRWTPVGANQITSNQHHISSITQLKEYLKQCDKFYTEVMFKLSKKKTQSSGYFFKLCSETVEIL